TASIVTSDAHSGEHSVELEGGYERLHRQGEKRRDTIIKRFSETPQSVTVEAWVKVIEWCEWYSDIRLAFVTNTGGYDRVGTFWIFSQNSGYYWDLKKERKIFQHSLPLNKWTHLKTRYDSSDNGTIRYYENDKLQLTIPNSGTDVKGFFIQAGGCCGPIRLLVDDVSYRIGPKKDDVPGEEEDEPASLVAHWKLDEGEGDIARDSAGDNDGKVYGAQWSDGILGGATEFDGSDDYVGIGPGVLPVGDKSIFAWVNLPPVGLGQPHDYIIYRGHSGGVYEVFLYFNDGTELRWYTQTRGGFDARYVTSLDDNEWHLVGVTYDSILHRLYLDGKEVASSDGNDHGPIVSTEGIGGFEGDDSNRSWLGRIDDVRIYDVALSTGKVKTLYDEAPSGLDPPERSKTEAGREEEDEPADLVAHWRLDEGEGDIARDSAGINHGTIRGARWTSDGSLRFDGVDDYIDIPTSNDFDFGTGDFSISAWFKTTDPKIQHIVNFRQNDNDPHVEMYMAPPEHGQIGSHILPGDIRIPCNDFDVKDGAWHHAAITLDNGANDGYKLYLDGVKAGQGTYPGRDLGLLSNWDSIRIGNGEDPEETKYFNGEIDEVRIYDGALSAGEVEQLYEAGRGGLVCHWKFDEAGGSVAYDSAGDNNATIHGASWADGILDTALEFDGEGDYLEVESDSSFDFGTDRDFSVAAWIKTSQTGVAGIIVDKREGPETGYCLSLTSAGTVSAQISDGIAAAAAATSFSVINDNRWHHIIFTVKRSGAIRIYVDGIFENETDVSSVGSISNTNSLYIGRRYTNSLPFSGIIDEVRIYDIALSAAAVEELYGAQRGGGLVGHWKFDEAGGTVAYDSAGDNDGTIHGASWADGILGGALEFDGEDDYVEVADAGSMRVNQDSSFSVSAWVRPSSSGILLSKLRGVERPGIFGFMLQYSSDSYFFKIDASYIFCTSISTASERWGDWEYVTAVYDNRNMKLYLNGSLRDSGYHWRHTRNTKPQKPFAIGRASWDFHAGKGYYKGTIDEVRFYNRALSAQEVQQLYVAMDKSGNNNHGKVVSYTTDSHTESEQPVNSVKKIDDFEILIH
ncbi:MAG: LamG domain-containing protein, partial [Planctomycetota bacterium]